MSFNSPTNLLCDTVDEEVACHAQLYYKTLPMPQSIVENGKMNGAMGDGAAVPDAAQVNNLPPTMSRQSTTVSSSDEVDVKECLSELSLDDGEHFEDEHNTNLNDTNTARQQQQSRLSSLASSRSGSGSHNGDTDAAYVAQEQRDTMFVESFWTAYDEILILSIFTQVGILCRLLAAYWLKNFSDVFHPDSALFTNLPLNCLSCFIMGLLCSGESLMEIVVTRFTPPKLQRDLHREVDDDTNDDGHISIEDSDEADNDMVENDRQRIGMRRRWQQRRRRRQRQRQNSNGDRRRINNQRQHQQEQDSDIYNELREVQLLAWERRIRASVCLLLFPVKKEDIDIVENYFSEGYRKDINSSNIDYTTDDRGNEEEKIEETSDEQNEIEYGEGIMMGGGLDDLILEEIEMDDIPRTPQTEQTETIPSSSGPTAERPRNNESSVSEIEIPDRLARGNTSSSDSDILHPEQQGRNYARGNVRLTQRQYGQVVGGNIVDYGTRESPDLDQIISNVATGVSNNISRIGRVNLANGWDVGTSAQEKSEDLTLGLRDGLCGALSSFSSWISSMVNLFRAGQVGQAFVGITLGIQLPIVAYRFGQYVSVYVFVWRCRREKGKDERRGYGIQLHTSENEGVLTGDFPNSIDNAHRPSFDSADSSTGGFSSQQRITRTKGRKTVHDEESEIPSIRAIFTALFIMCLVAQLTSLTFFKKPDDRLFALSLLFSPLGVLARWRMMKFNSWRPNFPIGTFACNVTACALSGTLGTLLAGNPGPRERIALVSIVAGFGGTLSSVARFIVEILSLMDPILFRLDGLYYATASVLAGLLVSFLFAASVDWADSVE